MESVYRSYNAKIDDVDVPKRTIVAKINSAAVDYYRSVIDPRGADLRNYNESYDESIEGKPNKPVLWEHGLDPVYGRRTIGKNLWIRADKSPSNPKIIACTQFKSTDFAMELFDDYRNGFLSAWSVSVLPTEYGPPKAEEIRARPELKDCEVVYRKWTLLEYSAVAVPGNGECLTLPESPDAIRSLNKLVVRGFWSPPTEIKEKIEKAMTESQGMANGGALVKPDDTEDKSGACCDDKTKKRATDADEDEDADEDDDADTVKEGITITGGGMAVVGMNADDAETVEREAPQAVVEPEPAIELPPLPATVRTIGEMFAQVMLEERDYRHKKMQEFRDHIEWLQGKA